MINKLWIHETKHFKRQYYLIGQKFGGQNFRRTNIFGGQNFRHWLEISAVLSAECFFPLKPNSCFYNVLSYSEQDARANIIQQTKYFVGQNFRRTKFFGGQKFRREAKFSAILSAEFLSDKVPLFCFFYKKNLGLWLGSKVS